MSLVPTSPTASSAITSFTLWARNGDARATAAEAAQPPSSRARPPCRPHPTPPHRRLVRRSRPLQLAPFSLWHLLPSNCVYLPADDWLMISPTQTRTHSGTEEGKSGPSPAFVNQVLLEHSHAHSFTCCLWPLWRFTGRDERATPAGGSQSPGASLSGPDGEPGAPSETPAP